MILTEEEAKTKWCPHGRVWQKASSEGITSFTTHGCMGSVPICIGSACMAWRFVPQGENYSENMATGDRTYLTPVGYCGLAGKP